jgi:predicted nucleic-acid-binding protein
MAKSSIKDRLDAARIEHESTLHQIAEAEAARNSALLADDDKLAARVAAQIDGLRQAARGRADKITLLESALADEENARRVREKSALINRVEAKLAERDAIAAELQDTITRADKLYRDLVSKSREVDAGWPFPGHDRAVVLLPAESIVTAVRNEIFRHSRPPPTGQQGTFTVPNFPGGQSPTLQLLGTPEKTQPLVDKFREGTAVASRIMREGKSTSGKPAAGPSFADGVPDFMRAEPPPRSAAQERLGQLLADQARLANDISPDGEAKYQRVVAEIATLQGEIEAARSAAA